MSAITRAATSASSTIDAHTAAESVARRRQGLRSVSIWGSWTLVSRIAGFVREILMASAFGTSSAASALVIAQTVPNLARTLVSEEVARGALLPVIAEDEHFGRSDRADALSRSVALWTTAIMLGVSAVVWVTASHLASLLTPGSASAASDEQSGSLLRLLTPIILISGIGAASSALLVARGQISAASMPLALTNVPLLIGLVAFRPSIRTAALLLVAGFVLQVALQGVFAWAGRRRPSVWVGMWSPQLRLVGSLAIPVALALGASAFSGLVDTAFSTLVGSGGPAALDKAIRLILVPYGVFAVAIGVIVMPAFVRARVEGDSTFDSELVQAVRLQASILVPAGLLVGLLAHSIVHIVYERGSFNADSARLTSHALVGMAFVLPAFGLGLIGSRAWLSRKRPWFPATLMAVGVGLNAFLDWLLLPWLGLFGIGLATAIVHTVVGGVLVITAARNAPSVVRQLSSFFARLAVVLGVSAGASILAGSVFFRGSSSTAAAAVAAVTSIVVLCRLVDVDDYRHLISSALLRIDRTR